jgi:hypothetical protein
MWRFQSITSSAWSKGPSWGRNDWPEFLGISSEKEREYLFWRKNMCKSMWKEGVCLEPRQKLLSSMAKKQGSLCDASFHCDVSTWIGQTGPRFNPFSGFAGDSMNWWIPWSRLPSHMVGIIQSLEGLNRTKGQVKGLCFFFFFNSCLTVEIRTFHLLSLIRVYITCLPGSKAFCLKLNYTICFPGSPAGRQQTVGLLGLHSWESQSKPISYLSVSLEPLDYYSLLLYLSLLLVTLFSFSNLSFPLLKS